MLLQLTLLVISSFRPPMWTRTTCYSCVGTWIPWWRTYLGIFFLGHQAAAMEVPRLIRMPPRLIVMMKVVLLQLREEDFFDANAWFPFFAFLFISFYLLSFQNKFIILFTKPISTFYLLTSEYNFLHLFDLVWTIIGSMRWNPLHLIHWKSTSFCSTTTLSLSNWASKWDKTSWKQAKEAKIQFYQTKWVYTTKKEARAYNEVAHAY